MADKESECLVQRDDAGSRVGIGGHTRVRHTEVQKSPDTGRPARGSFSPVLDSFKRCAIYTRKSSEEGLEQDFNSLHAQREACEAYVQSQRHEGWRLLRGGNYQYDDGGLSGGNMDRPGLQAMLAAIEGGEIDVVVVYKVDRLTRSLADFARIVDVLDKHGVSFVSVTQAFNTTSSMGRLTLNVLLSFAQFEREVTAERIRDKIAASKRKGMWMGGPVPLGYRSENKRLVVDGDEATIVRRVFETYLRTRSLIKTKAELDEAGIVSRRRSRKTAGPTGGVPFSPAALSALLRNPVYIGKIRHKAETFDGQHEAIISEAQFETAQQQLDAAPGGNRPKRTGEVAGSGSPRPADTEGGREPIAGRLLMGRLFDANGNRMSPTHTNKRGARYRYYLSTAPKNLSADEGNSVSRKSGPHRIPASKIEAAALEAVAEFEAKSAGKHSEGSTAEAARLQASEVPLTDRYDTRSDFQRLASVKRADVTVDGAVFTMESKKDGRLQTSTVEMPIDWHQPVRRDIRSPALSSKQTRAEKLAARKQRANQKLVRAIAIAHRRYRLIRGGDIRTISELASRENCSVRAIRLGLNFAWLAPDIVQAAMDGKLDASISATELARNLPQDWTAQRRLVGLPV